MQDSEDDDIIDELTQMKEELKECKKLMEEIREEINDLREKEIIDIEYYHICNLEDSPCGQQYNGLCTSNVPKNCPWSEIREIVIEKEIVKRKKGRIDFLEL